MKLHLTVSQFVLSHWTACILLALPTAVQQAEIEDNQESSYFFYQRPEYPKDCEEVFDQCSSFTSSGVYFIKPEGYREPFEVYCDYGNSERWTVILRRNSSSVGFHRNWSEYKAGFGFFSQEHWLGSEKISYLTNQKQYELRIDFLNADDSVCYLNYSLFRTVDEDSDYSIANLGQFSGNIEECFTLRCPKNMQLGDCRCQKTCMNPNGCHNTCTFDNICVCSDGFYLKEAKCVPLDECTVPQCIIEDMELEDGEVYINADCTMQAICNDGHLTINNTFKCNSNEVCDERNGLQKCYNESLTGCIVDSTEIQEGEAYVNADCTMRVVCTDGQLITNGTFMCSSNEVCDTRNSLRQCYKKVSDCFEIYNDGFTQSGVYTITPTNWSGPPFRVYCNMTDGGGWTVFQRRSNGNVGFYRDWNTYKKGFGSSDNEHWLGNDKLYHLTNPKRQILRIDFVNQNGAPYYAKFDFFRISDESDDYRLIEVGDGSGTAGAYPLINHRGYRFSTYDQDNDIHNTGNCAEGHRGGWWYHTCTTSNLNGVYRTIGCGTANIWWPSLLGSKCITFVEMKIHPF